MLVALLTVSASTAARAACVGDCDGNGRVAISELIRGVNIGLDQIDVDDCPSFDPSGDREVSIDELVTGVDHSLGTCPADPTATPSPTPTRTAPVTPPTATPTLPPAPPILAPVGNRTAVLGTTLAFTLEASDANDDSLTFSASPLPLPAGATLDSGSGAFRFSPRPDQVGAVPITFIVSDGALADEETITITVPPQAEVTTLGGQVITTGGLPLAGVRLVFGTEESTQVETFSGADGRYFFEELPVTGRQRLLIDGRTVPSAPAGTYATVPELIEVIEGGANQLEPPIVLLPLDVASADPVMPDRESVVSSSPVHANGQTFAPVELTVAAGAAHMEGETDPFAGMVYISTIPGPDLGPRPLPPDLTLSVYIAIQPFGVVYDPPADLSFPNVELFPEGSVVDIFGLNHDTGRMEKVGDGIIQEGIVRSGTLNPDGTFTRHGVVRNNSWHGFVPQPPDTDDDPNDNPDGPDPCEDQAGSTVCRKSGGLSVDHDLPSYLSRGKARALRLEYNSLTAAPAPVVSVLSTPGNLTPAPMTVSTDIEVAGVRQGTEVFFNPPAFCPIGCPLAVLSRTFDASQFETGVYPATLSVNCNFPLSRRIGREPASAVVVNERASALGVGWSVSGLERVHPTATGELLLTDGDDTPLIFTPAVRASAEIDVAGGQDFYHFAANAGDTVTIRMNRVSDQPDGSGSLDPAIELRDSRGFFVAENDDGGSQTIEGPGRNALILGFTLPATDTYVIVAAGSSATRGRYDLLLTAPPEVELVAGPIGGTGTADIERVVVSPAGDFSTFEAHDDGTYSRRLRDGTTTLYDANGLATSRTDRNGNAETFAYEEGRLVGIEDSTGLVTTFRYTAGLLSEIEDPAGRITRFEHDPLGDLVEITDPDGGVTSYEYDEHLLTSQTNPRRLVTRYEYDPFSHRLLQSHLPDGSTRAFSSPQSAGLVDPTGGLGTAEDPAPSVPVSMLRSTTTDGNQHTATSQTDSLGYVVSVTDALQRRTLIDRDGNGMPTRIQLPNGAVIRNAYDDRGNLIERTEQQIDATMKRTYEPVFNQITSVTDPEGNETTLDFDSNGNLVQLIDAEGTRSEFAYDETACPGLMTSATGAVGLPEESTTTFSYDQETCNPQRTVEPTGNPTTFRRDAAGNVVELCDGLGRRTRFRYDAMNRLTKVMDATTVPFDPECRPMASPDPPCPTPGTGEPGVTCYELDANGNVTAVVDPQGNRGTFAYDERDRVEAITDPLGRRRTFEYDGNGNLLRSTDRRGIEIEFRYDAADQLMAKAVQAPGGPEQVTSFTYDPNGRITTVVDPDSALVLQQDLFGRVMRSSTEGSPSQPEVDITYTYDRNDRLRTMTDPTGMTSFDYDKLGRMAGLTNQSGQAVAFGYDANSKRTRLDLPNGTEAVYDYDTGGRLIGLLHRLGATTISAFGYGYDAADLRTSLTAERSAFDAADQTFEYDALGQLTDAGFPLPGGNVQTFEYSPAGNRLRREGQAVASPFDAANRQLEDEQSCFGYDFDGNLTTRTAKVGAACTGPVTRYTYDGENRLERIDQPDGGTIRYRYDGLGQRIEKNVDGRITRYVYKQNRDILLEYDGANTLVARYTHGPGIDVPVLMERDLDADQSFAPSERFAYHADALGSIVDLTESAGGVRQAYVYDSFGNIVAARCGANVVTGVDAAMEALGDPSTCLTNPYTYTARELDPESGLHYYRARHYDPTLGRFLQEDPIRIPGMNQYTYVRNNPVNRVDPLGRQGTRTGGVTPTRLPEPNQGVLFPPGLGDFPDKAPPPQPGQCVDPLNPLFPNSCGNVPEEEFEQDDEERVPTELYVALAILAGIGIVCILVGTGGAAAPLLLGASDRRIKQSFAAVDRREILRRLAALPIESWSYKQDPGVRHIGPMAQDFAAAFGIGEDDTHINFVDANGVAMAAIQELLACLREQEAEVDRLGEENEKLESRIAALEATIEALVAPVQTKRGQGEPGEGR